MAEYLEEAMITTYVLPTKHARKNTICRAQVQPDEIYNLGAMSHVKVSFEMSEYTAEADGVGVLRLLNAIRSAGLEKKTRLYQVTRKTKNHERKNNLYKCKLDYNF